MTQTYGAGQGGTPQGGAPEKADKPGLRRKPPSNRMDALALKAMLTAEKLDALAAMGASKLAAERAHAMDYYNGDMSRDMPAADGRSRAVSCENLGFCISAHFFSAAIC